MGEKINIVRKRVWNRDLLVANRMNILATNFNITYNDIIANNAEIIQDFINNLEDNFESVTPVILIGNDRKERARAVTLFQKEMYILHRFCERVDGGRLIEYMDIEKRYQWDKESLSESEWRWRAGLLKNRDYIVFDLKSDDFTKESQAFIKKIIQLRQSSQLPTFLSINAPGSFLGESLSDFVDDAEIVLVFNK